MTAALALARRGLGNVSPNPAVGCVLVRDDLNGRIVGRGWTQPGGRPHAETEAIQRAGDLAKGATAYVTLEPCNHQGQTGPCSTALIKAGVKCVVVAIEDPDPRTSGAGIQRIREAKIEVITGVMADAARTLNAGFISRINNNRPIFSWKSAATLDGRIATRTGDSKWITGEHARRYGHLLRAQYDAIIVGSETALNDDPTLNCRLPGMENLSPTRIVLSKSLRLSLDSQLVKSAKSLPLIIYTHSPAKNEQNKLEEMGVTVIDVGTDQTGRISIPRVAVDLARLGMTRILLEGGGTLAASFLGADLIDRIYWFSAPKLIGSEGRPSLGETGINQLIQSPAFTRRSNYVMGADNMYIFDRDRDA